MSAAIIGTQDTHLAAAWYAAGLVLIEASAVEDPYRIVFKFRDPTGREPEITKAFFRDVPLQNVLQARRQLARAVAIAKSADSRRCSGDTLNALLWNQQRHTYQRVASWHASLAGKRESQ